MPQYVLLFEPGMNVRQGLAEAGGLRAVSFFGNRLVVVETDYSSTELSQLLPAVKVISSAMAELSEFRLASDEALFVAAWQASQNLQNKKRIGEGLPWDTEGFHPPDRPRKP